MVLFAELRVGVTVAPRPVPPFRLLKSWCQVVAMAQHPARCTALRNLALQRGEYPAAYYRLVRSTSGHPWTVVESRGIVWLTRLALHAWAPHTSS